MPRAWQCVSDPSHGAFLQKGIEVTQAQCPWARRGLKPTPRDQFSKSGGNNGVGRFACPRCCSEGKPGFVRPATESEAANLAA